MRTIERACRRAGIPLRYSEGFNPHPKLSFGPPLALGYTSEAEFLDLELSPLYTGNLIEDLNPALPAGLEITALKEIREKTEALASLIDTAEYEIDLTEREPGDHNFETGLKKLLDEHEIRVERHVKGRVKEIDIRPYIDSMELKNGRLHIRTRKLENRTVRVSEILNVLAGEVNGFAVHRKKQLVHKNTEDYTPFDVLS